MNKALIIGGNGFIGTNLTKRLKSQGWYVEVIDIKESQFGKSEADRETIRDVRNVLLKRFKHFDRIYQLAADMGGAGFVFTGENDANILSNSLGINLYVCDQLKEIFTGKLFYSSSVCAYTDGVDGREQDAYPANPPSNYGWEKLTSERIYQAHAKNYGLDVRIARFHNCFGPFGCYEGGREKSPAAICRKVIDAIDHIEIWGSGEQLRPFIFIEDLLDGIEALMYSNFQGPVNLGPSDGITINQLVAAVCDIADKTLEIKHIDGPTGGMTRHANNDLAREMLGWHPTRNIRESLVETYIWIKNQKARK